MLPHTRKQVEFTSQFIDYVYEQESYLRAARQPSSGWLPTHLKLAFPLFPKSRHRVLSPMGQKEAWEGGRSQSEPSAN